VLVLLVNENTAPEVPVVPSSTNNTVSATPKVASSVDFAVAFSAVIAAVTIAVALFALGVAKNVVNTESISNAALLSTYCVAVALTTIAASKVAEALTSPALVIVAVEPFKTEPPNLTLSVALVNVLIASALAVVVPVTIVSTPAVIPLH
jgi:hypothetical protein